MEPLIIIPILTSIIFLSITLWKISQNKENVQADIDTGFVNASIKAAKSQNKIVSASSTVKGVTSQNGEISINSVGVEETKKYVDNVQGQSTVENINSKGSTTIHSVGVGNSKKGNRDDE